jgi:hypothetical protein
MAERRTIKLSTPQARQRAHQLIEQAPDGYVVRIGEETRSDEQNRLLWPLIADIQQQVQDMHTFSAEDIKLRFLDSLGMELRFLPKLEGAGMFPVGQRSSTLSKSQFSGLLELIFAYGAKHEVKWSYRSLEALDARD